VPHRNNVRPYGPPLTDADARELLAKSLLRVCSEHGPTRVGKAIGCDEKTVRNARDEKSTLSLDCAANLLGLDGTALDPFLIHFGRRSVPIGAVCDVDSVSDHRRHSTVLKAALALAEALEDDGIISPAEVRQHRAAIEAARNALDELLDKQDAPKVRAA
jgi:hypothetical protein